MNVDDESEQPWTDIAFRMKMTLLRFQMHRLAVEGLYLQGPIPFADMEGRLTRKRTRTIPDEPFEPWIR